MSFHLSMDHNSMNLVDGHVLKARLRNNNGDWVDSELELNDCLGNHDGELVWGAQGFRASAENVTVSMEQDCPMLRGHLRRQDGSMVEVTKNLAEHIGNHDGTLVCSL